MCLRGWKEAMCIVPALALFNHHEDKTYQYESNHQKIFQCCSWLIQQKMTELGCPGMVVGVSVNSKNVWMKGFGYADIENNVLCSPNSVMRIASISKSITVAAVAKLMEDGKLNIDEPVQKYVPSFPIKTFDGEEVTITTRMLLSHLSGLRHYTKHGVPPKNEFSSNEYYSMVPYKSISDALDMFKDDPLFHKPGTKYLYTTHGYTLLSAVVESASGEDFLEHIKNMCQKFGMVSTCPELSKKIIYNRARSYIRNDEGHLENAPYVDLSYKWAGGGLLSTVPDLLKFGNVMLYSLQDTNRSIGPKGFLERETMLTIWMPATKTNKKSGDQSYGMGWTLYPEVNSIGCGLFRGFEVSHTGGAIGASSIIFICPDGTRCDSPPQGIVVAIITNLQSVDLTQLARDIANEFKFLNSLDSF